MAWLNGIFLKQCLGWQLLGERYWCLPVGLEYNSVVMLPSLTVMLLSSQDNLVFYISCMNFIDGWILLACSKHSSSSLSPCIHFMSMSSINRNNGRGCLSDVGGCHFGSHSCPIYLKIAVSVKLKLLFLEPV